MLRSSQRGFWFSIRKTFVLRPTLELFFSRYRVADLVERFEVDKFGRVAGLREARNGFLFGVHHAALEVW